MLSRELDLARAPKLEAAIERLCLAGAVESELDLRKPTFIDSKGPARDSGCPSQYVLIRRRRSNTAAAVQGDRPLGRAAVARGARRGAGRRWARLKRRRLTAPERSIRASPPPLEERRLTQRHIGGTYEQRHDPSPLPVGRAPPSPVAHVRHAPALKRHATDRAVPRVLSTRIGRCESADVESAARRRMGANPAAQYSSRCRVAQARERNPNLAESPVATDTQPSFGSSEARPRGSGCYTLIPRGTGILGPRTRDGGAIRTGSGCRRGGTRSDSARLLGGGCECRGACLWRDPRGDPSNCPLRRPNDLGCRDRRRPWVDRPPRQTRCRLWAEVGSGWQATHITRFV